MWVWVCKPELLWLFIAQDGPTCLVEVHPFLDCADIIPDCADVVPNLQLQAQLGGLQAQLGGAEQKPRGSGDFRF